MHPFSENIHVCLDNEATAVMLSEQYRDSSSLKCLTQLTNQREKWHTRPRGIYWPSTAGNINIRWCPGYSGIEGNEKAAAHAKETCRIGRELEYSDTIRHAKTKKAERYTLARTSFFEGNTPQRYIDLELKA